MSPIKNVDGFYFPVTLAQVKCKEKKMRRDLITGTKRIRKETEMGMDERYAKCRQKRRRTMSTRVRRIF